MKCTFKEIEAPAWLLSEWFYAYEADICHFGSECLVNFIKVPDK